MNLAKRALALSVLLIGGVVNAFAQGDDAGAACGALGCGVFALVYVAIIVISLGGAVALIVFVVKFIRRDAFARGMPNADSIKWLGLLGLLGLLIYLLTRPQGNVLPCPACGLQRMQGLPNCPHCGNA